MENSQKKQTNWSIFELTQFYNYTKNIKTLNTNQIFQEYLIELGKQSYLKKRSYKNLKGK